MLTTIKVYDTIKEADDAARLLYEYYKTCKYYNISFACNHSDRGYATVRYGYDLYIFTSKDNLRKVVHNYDICRA